MPKGSLRSEPISYVPAGGNAPPARITQCSVLPAKFPEITLLLERYSRRFIESCIQVASRRIASKYYSPAAGERVKPRVKL